MLLSLGVCAGAHAKPSPWAVVKEPQLAKAEKLERLADRSRVADDEVEGEELQQKLDERAAMSLMMAGGEQLGSASLLMLLGDCLAGAAPAYHPQALLVLERALELEPGHPQAAQSWVNWALAAESGADVERAILGHTRALELEWNDELRAATYHDRGRLQMARGSLEEAIRDFEAAGAATAEAPARALAEWSLGVAHDRNHDLPTARQHVPLAYRARFGPAGRTLVIDLEGGQLWPPVEEHYYRALALLTEALEYRAQLEEERYLSTLVESQFMWLRYVQEAPPEDRWVPRAREHLRWVQSQIASEDAQTDAELERELLRPAW